MGIILTLFIFQQTYAYITWPKYGGTLENTHLQTLPGKMTTAPIVLWSFTISEGGGTPFPYGPTADDVDGDGKTEVVVGMWDAKVYCLNGATGTVKWSYVTGGYVNTAPALADIDGDGDKEVVVGSDDGKIYCLDGTDGGLLWSYTTTGSPYTEVVSSPAIADLDGDGTMEVVTASRNDSVYCLNGKTGAKKWGYATNGEVVSCPAVADVDGDGIKEVVIGSEDTYVYCLKGNNGSLIEVVLEFHRLLYVPADIFRCSRE